MADLRVNSKMLRSSTRAHKKLRAAQTGAGSGGIRERAVASHPLFSGTIYLANLKFRRKDQGDAIIGFSDADIATVLQYMDLACPTILHYTSQYGQASATISPQILNGVVDVNSAEYNTGDLENWIHTIAKQSGVGNTDCICVLNPPSMTDTSDSLASGIGGYHESIASCRYIFVNVMATGLTVADRDLNYADSLSHEMAEMIVDPAPSSNPEVCDPCAGNCGHVTLNFFMRDGSFVGSVTDALLLPVFDYFVEGIVQPAFVHTCPAPFPTCAYFPEIWTRLGGSGYRSLATAAYADGRMALFALGSNRDAWRLDQVQPGGPWGAWQSFGAQALQALAVTHNADGRLELFALGEIRISTICGKPASRDHGDSGRPWVAMVWRTSM